MTDMIGRALAALLVAAAAVAARLIHGDPSNLYDWRDE